MRLLQSYRCRVHCNEGFSNGRDVLEMQVGVSGIHKRLFVTAAMLVGCAVMFVACTESNHKLADESRLPRWFADIGKPRSAYSVDIDVYTGGKVTMKLKDSRGNVIVTKAGELAPYPDGAASNHTYPIRQIVKVDGMSEILEQRQPGPLLYISDNPDFKPDASPR